jgi:two-component system chemotaxis response regulator CheY
MKKNRVLIVDDSAVMRKIVERSLRMAGVELENVMEANDGWEALALARETRADLVLCDINMPGMDGLEFVRQLASLENGRGVPVVMITTEAGQGRVGEAFSCGARGYIRKPFTPDQIREQVAPLLG